MSKGFTLKCNYCGKEIIINNYLELSKVSYFGKGIQVSFEPNQGISLFCNYCGNNLKNN